MKIALDAMGGDLAPKATVEGAVLAARDFGISVILVGDLATIEKELAAANASGLPITIEHAPEAVGMDESPIESVLGKPHSSMHIGYDLVKSCQADGFVSAGNSGAMMAAAIMILGNLPGVDRPAIASLIPTPGEHGFLIDAGANVEVKAQNLVEFAVMGSVYCRRVRKIARPRVGILSNGEEDSKGNDLTRAAAHMLREMQSHIDYIGYVEGRDINRGKVDVVVTDGFTGNVALKTMEGFAAFLLGNLRDVFVTNWRGRLAYFLIRKRLSALRRRLDPSEYGGAPLLGVNGVAIVAHGSSNPNAIRNAIHAAADQALVREVNDEIVDVLRQFAGLAMPAKSGGKGIRALFAKMRERLHRHPRDEADKELEVTDVVEAAKARAAAPTDAPHGEHFEKEPPPHGEGPDVALGAAATPSANGSTTSDTLAPDGSRHRATGSLKPAAPATDPRVPPKH